MAVDAARVWFTPVLRDGDTVACDTCGKPLAMGEWPFCPHGFALVGLKQIGDEIDEVNENVGHEPVHFRSRSEKKRYLKEHGLQEFVRHVGAPGSDKSRHTVRWV